MLNVDVNTLSAEGLALLDEVLEKLLALKGGGVE